MQFPGERELIPGGAWILLCSTGSSEAMDVLLGQAIEYIQAITSKQFSSWAAQCTGRWQPESCLTLCPHPPEAPRPAGSPIPPRNAGDKPQIVATRMKRLSSMVALLLQAGRGCCRGEQS